MNRNVLLVDASADLLFIWNAILASGGFAGVPAADPAEALPVATSTPLCAAVIDATLDEGAGWKLIERLAAHPLSAAVPVIALDEYPAPFSAMPRNVVAVLRKPVEPRQLLDLVKSHCLDGGAAEREA
jgi:CheY-like chemotaxis protein